MGACASVNPNNVIRKSYRYNSILKKIKKNEKKKIKLKRFKFGGN